MEVTAGDLEQDKREPSWLNGNWAARLEIVNSPVVSLEKDVVLDLLDSAIRSAANKVELQKMRVALFGEELQIASVAQSAEQHSLKEQDAGSMPAGSATPYVTGTPVVRDRHQMARDNGFEDLTEMNRLVASADITTPERYQAFLEWKAKDGTRAGLVKLPSR